VRLNDDDRNPEIAKVIMKLIEAGDTTGDTFTE
jgi:hypothetical protein